MKETRHRERVFDSKTEADLGRREDVLGHSQSFSKRFVGIRYVPGTVLSACDVPANKANKNPYPH